MEIREEIQEFVDKVANYSGLRLKDKKDVSILLQLGKDHNKEQVFEDLTFHAKYLHKLFTVLKRTSQKFDTDPKLSFEFKEAVEKVGTLVRTLIKEAPDKIKQEFMAKYFQMSHDSLNNLIAIAYDLSWIKNWHIDHKNERV